MTTTPITLADIPPAKCGKCGEEAEDGIFVVACRHVIEGDFDEDEDGEQVPQIHRYDPLASKPGPTAHLCADKDCPETELCADCWSDL